MREERIVSKLRRVLGFAMIVAGISIAAVQLAKGGAPTHAGEAGAAPGQAVEVPRIENAMLETRAVGTSLDATFRELSGKAERPEWIGYSVERVAGERGVCCDNNWNDGNCGTCRLEKENGGTIGTSHANGSDRQQGSANLCHPHDCESTRA